MSQYSSTFVLTKAVVERGGGDVLGRATRRKVRELELVRPSLDHGLLHVAAVSRVRHPPLT